MVEDHARHAYLRTLLNPAFNAASIASYMPAIEALVARHLASWEAAGQGGVLAYKALKKLTFEFIVEVGRGVCAVTGSLPDMHSSSLAGPGQCFCHINCS